MKKALPLLRSKTVTSVTHRVSPWHAVSVATGNWCCAEAANLSGTRFLSREAPRLPLGDCSAPQSCSCSYKHHSDRRGLPRRKDDRLGLRRGGAVTDERRRERGRREDD